ncbi:hypothetical protein XENTR_v10014308 [Xenopus tropicalis]|nr:hypothetical protein XENTR_v10014308 [Xenopus tropicalis]
MNAEFFVSNPLILCLWIWMYKYNYRSIVHLFISLDLLISMLTCQILDPTVYASRYFCSIMKKQHACEESKSHHTPPFFMAYNYIIALLKTSEWEKAPQK